MGEIIYSKYSSSEVTEALDFVLDTRDKLFFDHIFQHGEFGKINGGTYDMTGPRVKQTIRPNLKNLMRTRFFWISMLVSFPVCICSFIIGYHRGWLPGLFFSITIWICLYLNWFSTDAIPIYRGAETNMILWENRMDKKRHLWCVPEYYHFFGMVANYNLYKKDGDRGITNLGNGYAEAARDLSWLRCLCLLSEDIRDFAALYGQENIGIEFHEYYGEYTIDFTGTQIGDSDTVIPVEEQAGKRSFTLPSVIAGTVARKYREQGILDLSVYDGWFKAIEASHIIDGRGIKEPDYPKMLSERDQRNQESSGRI